MKKSVLFIIVALLVSINTFAQNYIGDYDYSIYTKLKTNATMTFKISQGIT